MKAAFLNVCDSFCQKSVTDRSFHSRKMPKYGFLGQCCDTFPAFFDTGRTAVPKNSPVRTERIASQRDGRIRYRTAGLTRISSKYDGEVAVKAIFMWRVPAGMESNRTWSTNAS